MRLNIDPQYEKNKPLFVNKKRQSSVLTGQEN